jgi:hypothetical protein
MPGHRLEPDRLAASLFLYHPDEAYEFALEFLNGALCVKDREGAMIWTEVLNLIEKVRSDLESEPSYVREMRASSMM